MAVFITIATIILFVVIVIWSFHNLEDIEKSRKIIYIIFEILLTGVITFVIFELSKENISYPSIDIMNTIKNPIVLLFTGINGCLIIPYMSKILAGVRQNSISTEELRKKIIILVVIIIAIVIFEKSYMESIQKGILEIFYSLKGE